MCLRMLITSNDSNGKDSRVRDIKLLRDKPVMDAELIKSFI